MSAGVAPAPQGGAPTPAPAADRAAWAGLATARGSRLAFWASMVLVVALWALARPYRGVRHDGVLYLGQILGRLLPDEIGRDLFLAYGSQDQYSLYSWLMAPLVTHLGVGTSQWLPMVGAEGLFLAACWALTRELPGTVLRLAAMLSLAVLPHTYGGLGAFSFAEPFLTARVLSEPFLLFGLALVLRGRPGWASLAVLPGVALHPLVALPVLVVGWVFLLLGDRRWLWMLLVLPVALALAAAGITPLDMLLARFDPEWLQAVTLANTNAFIGTGTVLDWAPAVVDMLVLLLAERLVRGSALARLLRAILWTTPALCILWGVGADLLHDILLTQLQLWRVFWLTHLFAVLVLPMVLLHYAAGGLTGRWCCAAIALAFVAVSSNWSTGWLCALWAGVALLAHHRQAAVSRAVGRAAIAGSWFGVAAVSLVVGRTTLDAATHAVDRYDDVGLAQVAIGLPAIGGLLGFGVIWLLWQPGVRRQAGLLAVAALALFGATSWDQRSEWQRYVEDGLELHNPPFAGLIRPGASVYWEGQLLPTWLLLHRQHYQESQQSSGLLFSRRTGLEYLHRLAVMEPLRKQQEICTTVAVLMYGAGKGSSDDNGCAPQPELLRQLCATPGGPDYIVTPTNDAAAVARWRYVPRRNGRPRDLSLYDCATLR